MNLLPDARIAETFAITLPAPDDFEGWRNEARQLLAAAVPPERVVWQEPSEPQDLFAQNSTPPTSDPAAPPPRVSRAFLSLAKAAILHSDPLRFNLLYRLLWRLQAQPWLLEDAADSDVRRINDLSRTVRRDIHKMRAFVRFREVREADGSEHFVAWFEPSHHILRASAAFFVGRFASMRWSILTPAGSLYWDGQALHEGPPARREDAPEGDPAEQLWKSYYASIFNPARLKIGAMLKEMPRRYWKNMPETALIHGMIAGAQAREAAMVDAGAFTAGPLPESLAALADTIAECRRCPIGCNGTRAVTGEGPQGAPLMLVGEQPGDLEEELGRPFVGPAGQLLRAHLTDAGIDATAARVTNAVKHFKFVSKVMRGGGKHRLHQSPTAKEIDMCRWWLDAERALVRPWLVLALGASAARGMLGRTVSVQKERGIWQQLEDGSELMITTHPSYLLRLDDMARAGEETRFAQDLRAVAARLAELAG